MKKIKSICLCVLLPIGIIISCKNNSNEESSITMKHFSSSEVIIKESFEGLVSKNGMPGKMSKHYFRRYSGENSFTTDSCEILFYRNLGLSYALYNDTATLYHISCNASCSNRLRYKNEVLDKHFTINDAKRCFALPDSCFVHVDGELGMCGLDTAGFIFCLIDNVNFGHGSYNFYFGMDSCLKGIFFPVRP